MSSSSSRSAPLPHSPATPAEPGPDICATGAYGRGLTLRYVLALALVAALSLASYGLIKPILLTVDQSASLINITGRQRMLTQRILAYCLLLVEAKTDEDRRDTMGELKQSLHKLEKNHRQLAATPDDPQSPVSSSPVLRAIYFSPPHDLDRKMRFFIDSARRFLVSTHQGAVLEDPLFLNVLVFGERELVSELDAVAREYQDETNNKLIGIRRLETATFYAEILLLLGVGAFLFRPMVARICTDRTRLEAANDELSRLAVTDQLTGAFNRLKFNEVIAHEIEVAARYHEPLSLLLFDIDHFKRVNDTRGHLVGDALLKDLAGLVKRNIRKVDFLFRYGGEEFLVVAPRTDLKSAATLAEKLRMATAANIFPENVAATISIGVTTHQPGESAASLIERTDSAMYAAKNGGRNRVVVGE